MLLVVTTCRRLKPRVADPRRHVKHVRHERRRGGFSDLSSDDADAGLFMGAHWSRLLVSFVLKGRERVALHQLLA